MAKLVVVGHPLAAEENRMAFRGWKDFNVDLVAPEKWKARSLGHVYECRADGNGLHALPVLASGSNSLFTWRGLHGLMGKLKPDLIYGWEEPWCLSSLQLSALARRLHKPFVFYTAENRPKALPWPFDAARRKVFAAARACVAPTAEIAATIRAAGYDGEVLILPLWIRARRRVAADPEAKLIAFVGRLIPLKRVHLLVEALALLPGWRLRVIGDGPERARLEQLARDTGVAGRAEFLGHVDNGDLEARLDGTSLLVLPTGENPRQAEQFGKAALEGVACGLPVLASRAGNLARLAETVPALAARDLDSASAMAGAVTDLLAAYPPPRALEAARDRVQAEYGPAAAARGLEAAFARLLEKSP
jgi:glycosyltransferase involved in cell wall biosynthesis